MWRSKAQAILLQNGHDGQVCLRFGSLRSRAKKCPLWGSLVQVILYICRLCMARAWQTLRRGMQV